MKDKKIRQRIDVELQQIAFTESMKNAVLKNQKKRRSHLPVRYAAAIILCFLIGGITVFAGYYFLHRLTVNDTVLPELDAMQIVKIAPIEGRTDEYGHIRTDFSDYDVLQSQLDIELLESEFAADQSQLRGRIETDQKDYAMIKMENYIAGNTEKYNSSISMSMDLILSQEQLENGWDVDYLGLYEPVESYTSRQGYKVNLIQDTTGGKNVEDFVSKKCAVFVADGIRYTLSGRTSVETMKRVVDSMI